MRAAVCAAYGPPEVIEVVEVDAPPLAAGEVRVRVHAAAVNFPDVLVIADEYQRRLPVPFIPGSELAGDVLEVGEGVTDLAHGDLVFGSTMVGGFAEEAVVAAAALTQVPEGVDLGEAAAFGVAHRTAYHSLRSVASLQPNEELVVLGAGGGVGMAAVQVGAALGATVTAVASTEAKLAAAQANGATHLVRSAEGRALRDTLRETLPGGADVVIDPVGGEVAEPALRTLRYGGRFVTVGYASGEIPRIPLNLLLLKGLTVRGFEMLSFTRNEAIAHARDEAELLDLFAAGRLRPHIGARFALDEAAAALRHVADGKAVGKVVITVR